jgi:acetolactate synthase-1/2/3 large subunit
VHLDVPQDVLQQTFAFEEHEFAWKPSEYRVIETGSPASQIEAAAEMLVNAERPLLIAGGGVARSMSVEAFRRIADHLDAPATATQMGLGTVSTASVGFIGHGGVIGGEAVVRAMEEADVVLAAGCRFSSWLWNEKGPIVRPGQKVIQIDVDPGAIGRLVPVQLGLLGDAAKVLPDLFNAVKQRSTPHKGRGWTAAISEAYRAYRTRLEELSGERGGIMHPAALAAEIGRLLPGNALVTYDGGHTSFWSNDFTPATEPRTRFHEPAMAQLGFGLPYAIALSLAHPQSPVFNITGDGSFGFTLQELDTARRYGAPVITIIHNNAAWGVIGLGQKKMGFDLGADLSGTDYAAIARGFGIHGELVTELADLGPAIRRSLASGLPAVIDCRTRFVPHPMMPAFGRTASVGMPPAAAVTR